MIRPNAARRLALAALLALLGAVMAHAQAVDDPPQVWWKLAPVPMEPAVPQAGGPELTARPAQDGSQSYIDPCAICMCCTISDSTIAKTPGWIFDLPDASRN